MSLICGTICTASFCTALGTAKNHAFKPLNYSSKPMFKGTIKTVSDIEDFARSRGCTFLFYEGTGNVTVKEVRPFLKGQESKKDKVISEAIKQKDNCTENSFVFSKIA